jgi:hypothetical protein
MTGSQSVQLPRDTALPDVVNAAGRPNMMTIAIGA